MDSETESETSFETRGVTSASVLGPCVNQLVNALSRGTAQIAADNDLTHIDYALLRLFLEVEEWTTTQLARVVPLAPSSISRTVNKLVYRGFIQRRRLLSDRRIVILTLTEAGTAVTRELYGRVQAFEAGLCQGVGEHEIAVLMSVTSTVMSNYADLVQQNPPQIGPPQ